MKRLIIIPFGGLFLALAIMATLAAAAPSSPAPQTVSQTACVGTGPNLLTNPSFEGDYHSYVPPEGHPDCRYGVCQTAQMADGWFPWWHSHGPGDEPYEMNMPEWGPALSVHTNPDRVRTGERGQKFFKLYSTFESGFYQQVSVTPGENYCFSIWGHSWSADDSPSSTPGDPGDAYSGPTYGALYQKVGIDPTGGTDWTSPTVIWSEPRLQYDIFGLFSLTATAEAPSITVFVYGSPSWAVKHNDVYWDDATLVQVAEEPELPAAAVYPKSIGYLSTVLTPTLLTRTITHNYTGEETISWTASLSDARSFTPTLSASSGSLTQPLTLSLDTTGYLTGTYTATLVISSTPLVEGYPVHIPLTLVVMSEIHPAYLPFLLNPE